MAEFVWEAKGRTGETKKGTMEAENEAAVHARLRSQQLNPVKVKKKGFDLSAIQIGSGVDPKDLVKFIKGPDFPTGGQLVTSRKDLFEDPALWSSRRIEIPSGLRPWTDDYSSIWSVLRL